MRTGTGNQGLTDRRGHIQVQDSKTDIIAQNTSSSRVGNEWHDPSQSNMIYSSATACPVNRHALTYTFTTIYLVLRQCHRSPLT